MSDLCPAAERPGGRHEWRLYSTREATEYSSEPDPSSTSAIAPRMATVRVYDTWYCTRCRTIETTERTERYEEPEEIEIPGRYP